MSSPGPYQARQDLDSVEKQLLGSEVDDCAPPSLDVELVVRVRAGDLQAKSAFYQRHVRAVAGTVIRLLGRRAEAADVVQDTFTHAFAEIGDLRDPGAARAWLLKIALRRVHRCFRRRRLLRLLGLDRGADDGLLARLVAPGAGPEVQAELAMIDRFLGTMPSRLRTPWILHVVEGVSLEEVARLEACSLATIKRRLKRANERLARHIGRRGGP